MANGASRIFDVMKNTSEDINTTSQLVDLAVKSISPLVFSLDDKADITQDFYVLDNTFDIQDLSVGDIVKAIVLNNNQTYYILSNVLIEQIGLLTKGRIPLASNTDLNTITDPGTYRSETSTISSTLSNCPITGSAFKMVVENLASEERIRQIIYANTTTSDMYVRTYAPPGTWGDWLRITDNAQLTAALALKLDKDNTSISNWNNVLTTQFVYADSNTTNGPTGVNFGVGFVHSRGEYYKVQYCMDALRNIVFSRNTSNGGTTWSDWNSLNTYTLKYNLIEIPQNADLNNYTTPGVYYCNTADVAKSLSNSPLSTDIAAPFKLVVEHIFSTTQRVKQTLILYRNFGTNFERIYMTSWQPWYPKYNFIEKTGTATTTATGYFSSGISRDFNILSVTVMKKSGGNVAKGEVYTRNDQTNHYIFVRDANNAVMTETEVDYRIVYVRK